MAKKPPRQSRKSTRPALRNRKPTGRARPRPQRPLAAPDPPAVPAQPAPQVSPVAQDLQSHPEGFPGVVPDFLVVGIGASAGGLEACSQLLQHVPADLGAALVVVQHLAANHDSMLPELLAGSSRLPVVQVTDGMTLEPNRVHVIPPDNEMGIVDGKLLLLPRSHDRRPFMPVDFFFRSLAEYARSQAVGVILSGTASDGSLGLKEIKGVGGIAIAQDPATAKYDGMPRSALATGTVDLVLSPTDIARELVRIARHPLVQPHETRRAAVAVAGDEHLGRVFALLRTATGVDFTHYKQPTIRRRLQRRMVLHKLHGLQQYVTYLQQNPTEVQALYQDILINVTRYFREPESFDTLAGHVFPQLLNDRESEDPIRVWVPGCSTGEEPYSVAMALLEFLGDRSQGAQVQIFATDISDTAIDHARAGAYPESIAADVSPERLRRFFTKVDGSYRINKAVRDLCIFARQDLTRDPPFSRLDLVVCRNVLIYLGPLLQKKLMGVFHYALKSTGFLMLGSAETIGPYADLFAVADKKHRLYTKKAAVQRTDVSFPQAPGADAAGVERAAAPARKASADARAPAVSIQGEATRVILNRFAPPAVIVDSDNQIVQFRGQTGLFLEPAPGEASLNLLKMAREGLLYGLRTALHEARTRDGPVRKEGLRVRQDGNFRAVNVEVVRLAAAGEPRHYLVLFEQAAPAAAAAAQRQAAGPAPRSAKSGSRAAASSRAQAKSVARLEQELAASRDYLQSIIQDLEATNEELQSANEEILSSNEELQSTNEELDTAKEELQSTNEELNTLNDELQGRNEELSRVNSDLVNLLGSIQIAIVMVAGDLKIRRFTPMAERVLNLIPADVGRRISDIKPNFDCPDLEQLIVESIDTVTVKEREVRDRGGRRYSLRVRPYKNLENRIDGAILALFDTEGRDTRALLDTLRRPLLVLDANLTVLTANKAYLDVFRTNAGETEGRLLSVVGNKRWNRPELTKLLREVLSKEKPFDDFRIEHDVPPEARQTLLLNARRVDGDPRHAPLILLEFEDVTETADEGDGTGGGSGNGSGDGAATGGARE